MPLLVSRESGNFTNASTWGVADSAAGSQLTTPSASTNTTTTTVWSSAFTGTNGKVVTGVAMFCNAVSYSGTVTVFLSNDNGVTTVTSCVVDPNYLPSKSSWVFFRFNTAVTLDGGTDYRVGVRSSIAGSATFYRDATAGNWARILVTTDTAAPIAGDTMLIVGSRSSVYGYTGISVTMDNTATTDFGNGISTSVPLQGAPQNFNGIQIGTAGDLSWGTNSATNYYLKLSGNLIVWDGGRYYMGSNSTPCPRDSSMYLQFDCAANGDFGFCAMDGSNVYIAGQSRTVGKDVVYCRLAANAAANATSLTVDADTGWLDNDQIIVTSTTRTIGQSEVGTLNGAAGASTLTIDGFGGAGGGLQFAHDGVAPFQAEVALLTRNVRISGASASLNAYVLLAFTPIFTANWAEFFWLGTTTTSKRGIEYGISGATSGTVSMQYCAVRNSGRNFFILGGGLNAGSVNLSNNVFWSSTNGLEFSAMGNGSLTVNNNVISNVSSGSGFSIVGGVPYVFTNNVISSCQSNGVSISGSGGSSNSVTFTGNTVHSCSSTAFNLGLSTSGHALNCDNLYAWRCSGAGISTPSSFASLTISNSRITGCANNGISITPSAQGVPLTLNNVTIETEAGFSTTSGLSWSNALATSASGLSIVLLNCSINTATNGIVAGFGNNNTVTLQNTLISSPTEVSSQSSLGNGVIRSSRHDQTNGSFRSWFASGRIESDTIVFNTASPSERLTPISSSSRLQSGSRIVAVDSGSTVTISAYVRKSITGDGANYNGNQPRLIVKANPACGITTDTVLATMTASNGTWQQLTGTTSAVNADGGLEFVVDCDGTVGWVNVDDWSVA
jgi:hypothetical protein